MTAGLSLRASFDQAAQLYHEARPRYPAALFESFVSVTGLSAGARLLEIGPGTGQATGALAKLGFQITAVELGQHLAAAAREALKEYEKVEVITGDFEEIELPPHSYDLVYAATAFHWISPAVRFSKPYALLQPDGHLAIIHTNHVSDEAGDKFFFDSQPLYQKYPFDDLKEGFQLPRAASLQPDRVDEKLFTPIFFQAFPVQLRYTAQKYAKLLGTYSPVISLPPNRRAAFLQDIAALIDREFGGCIDKAFAMTLSIARKRC